MDDVATEHASMIQIEQLKSPDYAVVANWLSVAETNQWLADWRGKHVDARMISILVMNPKNKLYFVRNDGVECGLVALGAINQEEKSADVWYLLGDPQHSRKGIITEGIRKLVQIAFEELGLKLLTAQTMVSNQASRKVLEKNHFRETGLLRNGVTLDGEDVPRMGYILTSEELRETV